MSSQPVSVFIADSQPLFRHGLRLLLEAEPDLSVVGSAGTFADATRGLRQFEPDVLFLDPGLSASWVDQLREMTSHWPRLKVVVTGSGLPESETIAAIEAGARGILPRDAAIDLFGRCARSVATGQYWVGRHAVAGLVESLRQARTTPARRVEHQLALTARQVDVLRAVANSQTNREIAVALGISEDTVKQHLTTIFDKCGVSSRVELALFAVRHRLIE